MATKKFNTFEYASMVKTGKSETSTLHRYDAFETPYGYAFVLIANDQDNEQQAELSEIAMKRIKYFLENEPDEKSEHVTKSALIYTSGYLYQFVNKNPSFKAGRISCLCVLYCNEKVYYAWTGNVELMLFTGKRLFLLTVKEAVDKTDGNNDPSERNRSNITVQEEFLGSHSFVKPLSGNTCVEPVSGDKLIMASGNITNRLQLKEARRILCDNMPLQTQVARIMHENQGITDAHSSTLIVIRFYELKNTERKLPSKQLVSKPILSHDKKSNHTKVEKTIKHKQKSLFKIIKNAFLVIALVMVGYFIYDLFIFDPHPPVGLPGDLSRIEWQATIQPADTLNDYDTPERPVVPGDVVYTVRGGDTWGRIYTQFGVCSWFIINHPPNTGRFGREGSLLAGQRLHIPVKYSGKPELNPYYYREFATEKVGERCENVGQEFRQAFEDAIK